MFNHHRRTIFSEITNLLNSLLGDVVISVPDSKVAHVPNPTKEATTDKTPFLRTTPVKKVFITKQVELKSEGDIRIQLPGGQNVPTLISEGKSADESEKLVGQKATIGFKSTRANHEKQFNGKLNQPLSIKEDDLKRLREAADRDQDVSLSPLFQIIDYIILHEEKSVRVWDPILRLLSTNILKSSTKNHVALYNKHLERLLASFNHAAKQHMMKYNKSFNEDEIIRQRTKMLVGFLDVLNELQTKSIHSIIPYCYSMVLTNIQIESISHQLCSKLQHILEPIIRHAQCPEPLNAFLMKRLTDRIVEESQKGSPSQLYNALLKLPSSAIAADHIQLFLELITNRFQALTPNDVMQIPKALNRFMISDIYVFHQLCVNLLKNPLRTFKSSKSNLMRFLLGNTPFNLH